MLKFQNNNTIFPVNFEDFILTVFVIIDDLYKKYAPVEVSHRKRISAAKMSDPEIITVSICGELAGVDSENAWFNFIDKNFRHLFPNLCDRSRFNRIRRNLMQTTDILFRKLRDIFTDSADNYRIVDSFPLPVCKFSRAGYCTLFKDSGASYGICSSKKETYFGYKVHALITLDGFITDFEITPANIDDRESLRDLVSNKTDMTVIGDKGYIGKSLSEDLHKQNIDLLTLKRSNSKDKQPEYVKKQIVRIRRRIETDFSQLSGQLNAQNVLAKSFRGLCTRMLNKVMAYNLCIIINKLFNKNGGHCRIKQLVF